MAIYLKTSDFSKQNLDDYDKFLVEKTFAVDRDRKLIVEKGIKANVFANGTRIAYGVTGTYDIDRKYDGEAITQITVTYWRTEPIGMRFALISTNPTVIGDVTGTVMNNLNFINIPRKNAAELNIDDTRSFLSQYLQKLSITKDLTDSEIKLVITRTLTKAAEDMGLSDVAVTVKTIKRS